MPEKTTSFNQLSPESEPHSQASYEFISGTDIREPTEGRRADYRPYEATPLIYDAKHQDGVWTMMEQLIEHELSGHISKKTHEFILHAIENRMIARDGSNSASYNSRLNTTRYDKKSAVGMACMRAERGTGSVQDNDVARRYFGMASVEYGNLTVVGNKRLEHLPKMYAEVDELLGANRVHSSPYGARIVGFDRDPSKSNHLGAVRIQMKRHLGTLDDNTEIKQRTLAIIDLSPNSGFDQDIVQAIIDAYKNQSKDLIEDVPPLRRALEGLTKLELDHPLVLARNETIYGYCQETDSKIRQWKQNTSLASTAINGLLAE